MCNCTVKEYIVAVSEKIVPKPTYINTLRTDTFSPSASLTWSVSFAFGDIMTWGWMLKATTTNDQSSLLIVEYPFLCLTRAQ